VFERNRDRRFLRPNGEIRKLGLGYLVKVFYEIRGQAFANRNSYLGTKFLPALNDLLEVGKTHLEMA
jgi:hypothetical protein